MRSWRPSSRSTPRCARVRALRQRGTDGLHHARGGEAGVRAREVCRGLCAERFEPGVPARLRVEARAELKSYGSSRDRESRRGRFFSSDGDLSWKNQFPPSMSRSRSEGFRTIEDTEPELSEHLQHLDLLPENARRLSCR